MHHVGGSHNVMSTGICKYLLDGKYPPIHHVRGSHNVRPRLGEGQRLLGNLGQAGCVIDGSICKQVIGKYYGSIFIIFVTQ